MKWSKLYQYSINPEAFFGTENIHKLMAMMTSHDFTFNETSKLSTILSNAEHWRDAQSFPYKMLKDSAHSRGAGTQLTKVLLTYSAPMASTLGCWLQGMSTPCAFENNLALRQLALLADDVGVGRPDASRYAEFKTLLRRLNLQAYAVDPYNLMAIKSLEDKIFGLSAVLLAMSRRADLFGPELCGIDLLLRTIGIFPCWKTFQHEYPDWINWDRLNLSRSQDSTIIADPLATSREIVDYYCSINQELAQRIIYSVQWMLNSLQQWNALLLNYAENTIDPQKSMLTLIHNRARDASAYHQSYQLGGCPLTDLFKNALSDATSLMNALAKSTLITPGDSSKSILVNKMVSPGGKMFRVFNQEELDTIRKWIDYLPYAPEAHLSQQKKRDRWIYNVVDPSSSCIESNMELGVQPNNIREAYYVLQGRVLSPKARRFAIHYIHDWINKVNQIKKNPERSLPTIWPKEGLHSWLLDQHDKCSASFNKNSANELPSKEAVIDSTLQLAPLLLIDGSWLQGFTDMQLASSSVGTSLFKIYWDELGNGQYELNHPKIYRDLLHQMDVELAPTGSRQFIEDLRLRDDSFRLPVLWLCFGKLPITFMPEILGMNLAMELSGVGDGYRFANKFLKHYGFSTHFVDLHNTIDNVASGHSAWATDAIEHYIRSIIDEDDRSIKWERVCAGFNSMTNIPIQTEGWRHYVLRWMRKKVPQINPVDSELYHYGWLNEESR